MRDLPAARAVLLWRRARVIRRETSAETAANAIALRVSRLVRELAKRRKVARRTLRRHRVLSALGIAPDVRPWV